MIRRDIFFVASLAFFGLFLFFGVYLWSADGASSQDSGYTIDAKQAEESQKEEKTVAVLQPSIAPDYLTGPVSPVKNPQIATNLEDDSVLPSSTATQKTAKTNSNFIAPGSKVGDKVTIGDIEMVITKTTARHKVIDIILKGNNSNEQPKPLRVEKDQITYEIPADVDVNIDITEEITVDESPLLSEEQKAGK